jgi:hypothetical protein
MFDFISSSVSTLFNPEEKWLQYWQYKWGMRYLVRHLHSVRQPGKTRKHLKTIFNNFTRHLRRKGRPDHSLYVWMCPSICVSTCILVSTCVCALYLAIYISTCRSTHLFGIYLFIHSVCMCSTVVHPSLSPTIIVDLFWALSTCLPACQYLPEM